MAYRPIEVIIEEPPKIEVLIGEPEAITVDVGETKFVDFTDNPIIEPLNIVSNGEYFAPEGIDGYSPISVDVPIPEGYIIPEGEKSIKENGTYDVREFASVAVLVPRGRDIVAVSIREV